MNINYMLMVIGALPIPLTIFTLMIQEFMLGQLMDYIYLKKTVHKNTLQLIHMINTH